MLTFRNVAPALLAGVLAFASNVIPSHAADKPGNDKPAELVNVSYDPTRELYADLNALFAAEAQKKGKAVQIRQSHGGSTSQAKAVIGGLEADVVTLALPSDIEAIRKKGLIADKWQERLPNGSQPYYSTIVFVVRKGNPKQLKDWTDLVKQGVQIVTPHPKTSGNGQLSFLAAWGSALHRGQAEKEAQQFVTQLYKNVVALDPAARGSAITFAEKKVGDVHLTWENEARRQVLDSKGELEIVYPPVSIRAEPKVAWVDANVKKRGTQAAAEAYLRFLYSDAAQELIAKHHYRPIQQEALKKHSAQFPHIDLVNVSVLAKDWNDAHQKFFADGGEFDKIAKQLPAAAAR